MKQKTTYEKFARTIAKVTAIAAVTGVLSEVQPQLSAETFLRTKKEKPQSIEEIIVPAMPQLPLYVCRAIDYEELLFALELPKEPATGTISVTANTRDRNIKSVLWYLDNQPIGTTNAPFTMEITLDATPQQHIITAVAYNAKEPVYEQKATMNKGGRNARLEILSPVAGQNVHGVTRVLAKAELPSQDTIEKIVVTYENKGKKHTTSLQKVSGDSSLYEAHIFFPKDTTAIEASMTRRTIHNTTQTLDKFILVNRPLQFIEGAYVHSIDQLVGAYDAKGRIIQGLTKEEFVVFEGKKTLDVREVRMLKDTPLSIGLMFDMSGSMADAIPREKEAVHNFVHQIITDKDAMILYGFEHFTLTFHDWTKDKTSLLLKVEEMGVYALAAAQYTRDFNAFVSNQLKKRPNEKILPRYITSDGEEIMFGKRTGTKLYDMIIGALYDFQGAPSAKVLVMITDGIDSGNIGGSIKTFNEALEYARQSGVRIYSIGMNSSEHPDMDVLSAFANATGGNAYEVETPEDIIRAYNEIENDVRTQYVVSYDTMGEPTNKFHKITVRAKGASKIKTAAGYFY